MKLFDWQHRHGGKKAITKHFYHKIRYILGHYPFIDEPSQIEQIERIVFVCRGNICRSALAHEYFKRHCDFPVCSFGLDTTAGKHANTRVIEFSKIQGIDISNHRTARVEDYEYKATDLLVCMEPWQGRQVKELFPTSKTTLLGLFLTSSKPYLHDPYASLDPYVYKCIKLVTESVDNLINFLQQDSQQNSNTVSHV